MAAERCVSKRSDGQPCKGWRLAGSDKCKRHLANPKARANAAVRAEVLHLGFKLGEVDPGEILLKLVAQSSRRCAELAAELEALVAESPNLRDALVAETWIPTENAGSYKAGEYIRGLALLEGQERDRCAGFCAKAIAAGLAERQVRLAERQGALMADFLRAVLADPELGLTEAQQAAVPNIAQRHLALVS